MLPHNSKGNSSGSEVQASKKQMICVYLQKLTTTDHVSPSYQRIIEHWLLVLFFLHLGTLVVIKRIDSRGSCREGHRFQSSPSHPVSPNGSRLLAAAPLLEMICTVLSLKMELNDKTIRVSVLPGWTMITHRPINFAVCYLPEFRLPFRSIHQSINGVHCDMNKQTISTWIPFLICWTFYPLSKMLTYPQVSFFYFMDLSDEWNDLTQSEQTIIGTFVPFCWCVIGVRQILTTCMVKKTTNYPDRASQRQKYGYWILWAQRFCTIGSSIHYKCESYSNLGLEKDPSVHI